MCVFAPPRHRDRPGRRHDAAVLRARRRQAQPRHGRAGRALSRPEDHQVLRRRRQRRQAGQLRQGADRARRATTPPRTPTSPCSCGRGSSRAWPAEHMVDHLRDDRAAADPRAARHGAGRHQGRRAARSGRCRPSSRSGWLELEQRDPQDRRPRRSMSARPSSWARSCSTSRSCRAASATRPARGRPTSASWRTSRPRAMRCRSRSWSIARSPSSRAPTPTRWCASSTPRPAASTPPIR